MLRIRRKIGPRLPYWLMRGARPIIERSRQVCDELAGQLDLWTGRRDRLTPPLWMMRKCGLGPASYSVYERSKNSKAKILIDSGLRPSSSILDIGCGAGGLASGLKHFIGAEGSYTGFDISPRCIKFCRKAFREDSHFRFQLLDVRNSSYNPRGRILASQVRFPYPENTFDYVVVYSVFTHMLKEDVSHYLTEVRRVLKNDGKCVTSLFVWDGVSEKTCTLDFRYEVDGMLVVNRAAPEQAIAFRQEDFTKLLDHTGFRYNWYHYGNWRRSPAIDTKYQDIFLLEKNSV